MTTETSKRINYGRARLVIGFALLAIGLLISVGAWNGILAWQGDDRGKVHVSYIPSKNNPFLGNPLLFPLSFEMFEVPDYLLRYLILGVVLTTVGITIVASPLWKRLVGNMGDD